MILGVTPPPALRFVVTGTENLRDVDSKDLLSDFAGYAVPALRFKNVGCDFADPGMAVGRTCRGPRRFHHMEVIEIVADESVSARVKPSFAARLDRASSLS